MSFDDLNIDENILRGVYSHGFEKPSAIQSAAIPKMIEGKDLIAQAQSGTGKTGAFSIGTLCRIDESVQSIQSIILVPTRELAEQVTKVITDLCSYTKITVMKVIGGTNVNLCRDELSKNPHIVVGTPGRILDMIRRRYLPTVDVKLLTFDEADEILSHGFKEDIHDIIQTVNKNAQICIFSATLPDEILELTDKFMNNPERILVKRESLTLEGIQQFFVNINHDDWKYDVIADLYDTINIGQCIIYMNSKQKIVDVYNRLTNDNFPVDYISGDRTVDERNKIMNDFRSGTLRILLSSDLLARGIDIQQLSLVINFDLPREKETYIHRIGRSGRYGRKGVAINLITNREVEYLKSIEEFYDTQIVEMPQNIADYLN
uniref:RNA helicase n=1 Tax=viral metagenome TaxID=1070528 RepID=A0A6C0FBT8_9ZZZZ|tara:strand:- start:1191 stop:2318 length:1128 start_codon:yes stop_codon:yes gene_type:complete